MRSMTRVALVAALAGAGLLRTDAVGADAPPGRYTLDANTAIVTDNETGLHWQQTSLATLTWSDAVTYCANLDQGGKGWRLPAVAELGTLVDDRRLDSNGADPIFLPQPVGDEYWSSSPMLAYANAVWVVNFYQRGYQYEGNPASAKHVRCVR